MSDPNDNLTNQPPSNSSRRDITNEPQRSDAAYDAERPEPAKKSKAWLYGLLGCGLVCVVCCLPAMAIGLLIPAVAKVREAAGRTQSQNNVRQMGLAINSIAMTSPTGDIPPANGVFPRNGNGMNGSFFFHLFPYIEEFTLYTPNPSDAPVKTLIAPADHRNAGLNSTISYCTNGTLLKLPNPTLPGSFNGRTSSVIFVMERSGMDGAHKWTNTNNVLGTAASPPPFPQIGVDPTAYLETSPQGFTSSGCVVGLGDGSARIISNAQQNAWSWACDPKNNGQMPADW